MLVWIINSVIFESTDFLGIPKEKNLRNINYEKYQFSELPIVSCPFQSELIKELTNMSQYQFCGLPPEISGAYCQLLVEQ